MFRTTNSWYQFVILVLIIRGKIQYGQLSIHHPVTAPSSLELHWRVGRAHLSWDRNINWSGWNCIDSNQSQSYIVTLFIWVMLQYSHCGLIWTNLRDKISVHSCQSLGLICLGLSKGTILTNSFSLSCWSYLTPCRLSFPRQRLL